MNAGPGLKLAVLTKEVWYSIHLVLRTDDVIRNGHRNVVSSVSVLYCLDAFHVCVVLLDMCLYFVWF